MTDNAPLAEGVPPSQQKRALRAQLDRSLTRVPAPPVRRNAPARLPRDDVRRWFPRDFIIYNPNIRQSHMSTWVLCPRKYLYAVRMGLVPRSWSPGAATVGQFGHAVLEQLYLGASPLDAAHAVNALLLDKREKVARRYDSQPDKVESLSSELGVMADVGLLLGTMFHERHPLDPSKYAVVAAEIGVAGVPVAGGRNVYCTSGAGRMDLLVYSAQHNGLFVVDHKFLGDHHDLDEYSLHLRYDFQIRFYRLLAHAFTDGTMNPLRFNHPRTGKPMSTKNLKVLGAVVNIMTRPNITWKVNQGRASYIEEHAGWLLGQRSAGQPRLHASPFRQDRTPRKGVDTDGYILEEDGSRKLYYEWDHTDLRDRHAASPPWTQKLVSLEEPMIPADLGTIIGQLEQSRRCRPALAAYPQFGELTGACLKQFGRACPYRRLCGATCPSWATIVREDFIQEDPDEHD